MAALPQESSSPTLGLIPDNSSAVQLSSAVQYNHNRKRWSETGGDSVSSLSTEKHFKGSGNDVCVYPAPCYPSKLLGQLNQLRLTAELCDLVLVADGVHFPVHKNIMVSSSDYFKAVFSSGMRESRENTMELKALTSDGLKAVLDFIYSGSIRLSLDVVENILNTATHLQVVDAINLCVRYLQSALRQENTVDFLNLSDLYCLDDLRVFIKKFMLDRFDDLVKSGILPRLNVSQLKEILMDNGLRVQNEFSVFQAVKDWAEYNLEERYSSIGSLMAYVRLSLLTGEELVEKVSTIKFMQDIPECSQMLTEAKDYHIVVNKQPLMQTARTQVRNDHRSIVMCHKENLEAFNLSTRRHTFLRDCIIPLYDPFICEVKNYLYACGGRYDGNETSEIASARCFRYDPRFDAWLELTPMNEARKDFVIVSLNDFILAVGGQDENMVMCTVERYNISSGEWKFQSSLQHAVYSHAGAVCNNKVYISGGQRYDGFCNTLSCYDAEQDVWREKTPMLNRRGNHIMECVGSSIYILGGNVEDHYGFPLPITAVESYNAFTDQWTLLTCSLTIREAGSCVLNNKIYIAGGLDGEHYFSHSLQVYDTQKDDVELVERFPTRIYSRVCCIMILPQCV